jgi:hypothetical protein
MAGYRFAASNFTKGEISPEAEARFDIPVYNAAVRRALNVKVQRTGGLKKRMGTRFVAEALSSSSLLIPFQFSDSQAYALEMAQALMRPFALGGAVLETGLKITAITKATNAKITCAYHGLKVGDQVYLSGIQGMTQMNDRFANVLTAPTFDTFTINVNSTAFSSFTGDTGGQINAAPPPPPPPPPTVPTPAPTPTPPPAGSASGGGYVGGTDNPYDEPPVVPAPWRDDGVPPAWP